MDSVIKTVKLARPLAAALARAARARDCSESDLIRKGIERVLEVDEGLDMASLIGPDVGIGQGPRDLSGNREHLSGYGRSRHR